MLAFLFWALVAISAVTAAGDRVREQPGIAAILTDEIGLPELVPIMEEHRIDAATLLRLTARLLSFLLGVLPMMLIAALLVG